jgi:hypothetical protein
MLLPRVVPAQFCRLAPPPARPIVPPQLLTASGHWCSRWMVQSLNLAAIRTTVRVILREPALALPHAHVRDISELDFAKLRAAGCRGVVFDKDNTLTAPYSNEVYPRLAGALRSCVEAFGAEQVAVLSNSAGTPDDPGGVAADALQATSPPQPHLSASTPTLTLHGTAGGRAPRPRSHSPSPSLSLTLAYPWARAAGRARGARAATAA